MPAHDFATFKVIYKNWTKDYKKIDWTIISDEFISDNYKFTEKVEMYWCSLERLDYGLAYHGVTILDYKMAEQFKEVMVENCKPCEDLTKLVGVLDEAIKEKKYVVHYGV